MKFWLSKRRTHIAISSAFRATRDIPSAADDFKCSRTLGSLKKETSLDANKVFIYAGTEDGKDTDQPHVDIISIPNQG